MDFPLTKMIVYSYEEYGEMLNTLVLLIKGRFQKATHIFSPPRGGWPVAVHLSHHLEIPIIQANGFTSKFPDENHILFVDDIVDSGETLKKFFQSWEIQSKRGWLVKAMSCSLLVKPHALVKPDIYVRMIPDDTWVVFPWEKVEDAEKDKSQYLDKRSMLEDNR